MLSNGLKKYVWVLVVFCVFIIGSLSYFLEFTDATWAIAPKNSYRAAQQQYLKRVFKEISTQYDTKKVGFPEKEIIRSFFQNGISECGDIYLVKENGNAILCSVMKTRYGRIISTVDNFGAIGSLDDFIPAEDDIIVWDFRSNRTQE